jgi:hypothetical protein
MSEFEYEEPVTAQHADYDWQVCEQDLNDWLSDLAEQGL